MAARVATHIRALGRRRAPRGARVTPGPRPKCSLQGDGIYRKTTLTIGAPRRYPVVVCVVCGLGRLSSCIAESLVSHAASARDRTPP